MALALLVTTTTAALLILSLLLPAASSASVKRMVLHERAPVLPARVRLLADCKGTGPENCTWTCPQHYAIDGERQSCRPKRHGLHQLPCPPGYSLRSGAGGAAGCVATDEGEIQCPPGSIREGAGRCVVRSNTARGCPAGYVQRRGVGCVREDACAPGYRWAAGGLCFPPGAQIFCPPGTVEQRSDGTCVPAACRDCCDCEWEESATAVGGPVCPAGYTLQSGGWGRCVRVLQAAPELRIETLHLRLPVECGPGTTFNGGECESARGRWPPPQPVCSAGGHPYNGSCVVVATCTAGGGALNGVCSCEDEQLREAMCGSGALHEPTGSCVVGTAHCRPPARLSGGGACVRETDPGRPSCPEGPAAVAAGYCAVGEPPRCPPHNPRFTLDEHGLCRAAAAAGAPAPCPPVDCGRGEERRNGWCGVVASCPASFSLTGIGYCVKETVHPAPAPHPPCPEGTEERGDDAGQCVSVTPLCRAPFRYQPDGDACAWCEERPARCPPGANLTSEGEWCVWSESACPDGYRSVDGMCVAERGPTPRCRRGYPVAAADDWRGFRCVEEEVSCPAGYELLAGERGTGDICMQTTDVECPDDGSYPAEGGLCVVERGCPPGYEPLAGPAGCVREVRRPINASRPACPPGYEWEDHDGGGAAGGSCLRRTVVEASVSRRDLACPDGYTLEDGEGWCTRTIRAFAVCPPHTLYTDGGETGGTGRCYCEVELACPPGYERTGGDCTYRAAGFTALVHFLSPCYGAPCGAAHCLRPHCTHPPCPIEPCSAGGTPTNAAPLPLTSWGECGTGDGLAGGGCPPPEVIALGCPPGYERGNGTCVAYYDRRCPAGYTATRPNECIRTERLFPSCPPGYHHKAASCHLASCPDGYKLLTDDGGCERRELRSPKPCPPGHDHWGGRCYRRSQCRNGTVDGTDCIERTFATPHCPPAGYVLREADCARPGTCSPPAALIDGTCVRLATPSPCPEGTERWEGKLCVYPNPPDCDPAPHLASRCSGRVDGRDGRCWHRASPTCPTAGYRLRDGRCVRCETQPVHCPPAPAGSIRGGECIVERGRCPDGHFLRGTTCVQLHVALPRCPASNDFRLCGGFCFAPVPSPAPDCGAPAATEYALPHCTPGTQQRGGRCVEYAGCGDPAATLLSEGGCRVRSFTDTSCHGRGTKVRQGDRCVGPLPHCPPATALIAGRCTSCTLENARCPPDAYCSASFCHLPPREEVTPDNDRLTSAPTCPPGSQPGPSHDPHFCRLRVERVRYGCPPDHHHQQGVCLRKLYLDPTCSSGAGYRVRQGVCVRRTCARVASGVGCDEAAPSTSCAQCLNGTSTTTAAQDRPPSPFDLCCAVFSPRICPLAAGTGAGDGCYHERENLCGAFCLTEDDRIQLTVPLTARIGSRLYMAPRRPTKGGDGGGQDEPTGGDSCYPCRFDRSRCPAACDTYDCQREEDDDDGSDGDGGDGGDGGCNFRDAARFCAQHPHGTICRHLMARREEF